MSSRPHSRVHSQLTSTSPHLLLCTSHWSQAPSNNYMVNYIILMRLSKSTAMSRIARGPHLTIQAANWRRLLLHSCFGPIPHILQTSELQNYDPYICFLGISQSTYDHGPPPVHATISLTSPQCVLVGFHISRLTSHVSHPANIFIASRFVQKLDFQLAPTLGDPMEPADGPLPARTHPGGLEVHA